MGVKKSILALVLISFILNHTAALADYRENANPNTLKIASMTDVQVDHWAKKSIDYLVSKNMLTGYPDGTFKPNNYISREEAVKVIVLALNKDPKQEQKSKFPDVAEGFWAEEYINVAKDENIITGYPDGSFGLGNNLTRGEMAAILVRAFGLKPTNEQGSLPFPDVAKGYWAYKDILALYQQGVVEGYPDGTYGPENTITRAEFATFVERILNPVKEENPSPNPTEEITAFSFDFEKMLKEGQEQTLALSVTYNDGTTKDVTKDTTFKVENPEVAVIQNGKIKALKEGKTKLTANYKGQIAITSIEVEKEKVEEEKPIEEKPNPTGPIEVNNSYKLPPVTIKGFTFKHDGWYGDEGNPNPKYVMNGKPVKPDWVDERGFSYGELPEFSETPIKPGRYSFSNNYGEKIYDIAVYGSALGYIKMGLPLTKDEFINAVNRLNETKQPVTIPNKNIVFDFHPIEGEKWVTITVK
ncbi:S-layer homology domain-containing protein [Caldifermentibacillus hisashii]|uniref:S-layer homology domain-containing protein n=1 Tax=Caldifermentibacillus hisashii TaxID=996558 RepID=UPI003100CDCA